MTRTTVWAAQDGLLAALKRQPWPGTATRQVIPRLSAPSNLEADAVWISGQVTEWQREHPVSGMGQADESYVLHLYLVVTWLGGDYLDARARLDRLTACADAALSDHTLGGAVAMARVENQQLNQAVLEDGRRNQLSLAYAIRVDAWLPAAG